MTEIMTNPAKKIAGFTAIGGAICAVTGASLMMMAGADLDLALATGTITDYLEAVSENRLMITLNLIFWILMVFLIGIAGFLMTSFDGLKRVPAQIAKLCFGTAVPLVTGAYVIWLAIVNKIAPDSSEQALYLAEILGWITMRADWIATIYIVGIGPLFISLAGKQAWVPTWLLRWSYVTTFAALLNAVAMLTGGSGLTSYGFFIIPAGVGWMIAAGVVLLRQSRE